MLALEMLAELAAHTAAARPEELERTLRAAAEAARRARPSMAPVQNLIAAWLDGWSAGGGPGENLVARRERAGRIAAELAADVHAAKARAVAHAARLMGAGGTGRTLLTHSLSSTVLAVFEALAARGVRAIVTESRPLLEGRRTAAALARAGIAVQYITEAQIGIFMPSADAVLVGADAVDPDGAVWNKAGTYLTALAARAHDKPFHACFESFKVRRPGGLAPGEPAEENAASELGVPDLPGVTVRNVYFDRTPPALVSAWITEHGPATGWPAREVRR